jgi:protein phosphatase
VQQDLGPIRLSHVYEESSIRVDRLPAYDKQLVEQTINADDLSSARAIVEQLSDAGGE